jgi:hypothetical protein
MRIYVFAITLALQIVGFNAAHAATSCSGNACNDVTFEFKDGCYHITNHGTKRVKVAMGNVGFTLQRGETTTLTGMDGKTCMQGYIGDTTANYE